jgi:DNA-binding transcriptional regulator GbsR (MarR family)
MDQICTKLEISVGSASQGLKTLRSLKSVKSVYVSGERKDYFLAETEFRRLFSNFIKEEILPHLESAAGRIESMEKNLESLPDSERDFLNIRVEKLNRLTKAGKKLLPALAGLLKL